MNQNLATPSLCPHCGSAISADLVCPRCLMAEFAQPTQEGGGLALPPFTTDELAPHFPQLDILECLGRGGMGVVYKARQKSLQRLVALKLLAPERVGDADFGERFTNEAKALAALNHPHIVSVYDFGEAGGFYFLLMEFVDGVNLRQLLRSKRLTPQEALSIVPPVCEALQCAHDRGIVHRDIKPENLLLDKHGVVKIADFGIAKMVADGDQLNPKDPNDFSNAGHSTFGGGTPDYAAPEQRSHAATDHRADIYSLGVVLYEMLTGERPHAGQKLDAPSRKVQIDVRIDEIVLRALEQSPELRFATAADFRAQIETVRTTTWAPRRSPMKYAAAAILVLASLGVIGFALTNRTSEAPPASQSTAMPSAVTLAALEATYERLLHAERSQALGLENAAITEIPALRQRLSELERRVEDLSKHPTINEPPNTNTP